MEDVIVITSSSELMGILAEYRTIEAVCGQRNADWRMERQDLLEEPDGKHYDRLTVGLKDGTVREFYFDISLFYGKS